MRPQRKVARPTSGPQPAPDATCGGVGGFVRRGGGVLAAAAGRWCYLYRAIDSTGATINFVLSGLRDAATAKRLFRKALTDPSHPQPRVINTDQTRLYGSAIAGVKKERLLRRRCRHRPV